VALLPMHLIQDNEQKVKTALFDSGHHDHDIDTIQYILNTAVCLIILLNENI